MRDNLKRCCTCHRWKRKDGFVKRKSSKDGLNTQCLLCRNKAIKKHQEKIKNSAGYDAFLTYSRKRRKIFKEKCVLYKGGKCVICGYNKCTAALDFHHIARKNFALGSIGLNFNDKVVKELDHCILLCANCHRELHSKEDDTK